MDYLEYPKTVYLGGDSRQDSKVVHDADEEQQAAREGFQALPANPPIDPLEPGGTQYLPYPKILYAGGLSDGDIRRVDSAEQEAAEAANGFYALGAGPSDDSEPEASDDAPAEDGPKKRGRKSKA